jgi:FkbM family methyltransferase
LRRPRASNVAIPSCTSSSSRSTARTRQVEVPAIDRREYDEASPGRRSLRPGNNTIGILHRARQSAKILLNLRRRPKPSTLEEQVYAAVIRDGDICFDIGANVGWIALFLARTAGAAGKVVAFEPVWPTFMTMCANIQAAINVKAPIFTMSFGLAEEEKTAIIHVPDGRFEFSSLGRLDGLTDVFPSMRVARYEYRFLTLDGFLGSCDGLVADVWKLDVEGAELFVLRGAAEHFAAGHRPLIVVEAYAPWQHRCGYGPWDLFSLLLDLGYRFRFLCPGGLIEYFPSLRFRVLQPPVTTAGQLPSRGVACSR